MEMREGVDIVLFSVYLPRPIRLPSTWYQIPPHKSVWIRVLEFWHRTGNYKISLVISTTKVIRKE